MISGSNRAAWRILTIITSITLPLACKPTAGSDLQTLDNFAGDSRVYHCSGPYVDGNEKYLSKNYIVGLNNEALIDATLDSLSALPKNVKESLFDGRVATRVHLVSNAGLAVACPSTLGQSQALQSCYNVTNDEVAIYLPADPNQVRRGFVRAVAYYFTEFVPLLGPTDPKTKTVFFGPSYQEGDAKERLELGLAFLQDVLKDPELDAAHFKGMLSESVIGAKSEAALTKIWRNPQGSAAHVKEDIEAQFIFSTYVTAEAFDSYYCSKESRETLVSRFQNTAHALGIKVKADGMSLTDDATDTGPSLGAAFARHASSDTGFGLGGRAVHNRPVGLPSNQAVGYYGRIVPAETKYNSTTTRRIGGTPVVVAGTTFYKQDGTPITGTVTRDSGAYAAKTVAANGNTSWAYANGRKANVTKDASGNWIATVNPSTGSGTSTVTQNYSYQGNGKWLLTGASAKTSDLPGISATPANAATSATTPSFGNQSAPVGTTGTKGTTGSTLPLPGILGGAAANVGSTYGPGPTWGNQSASNATYPTLTNSVPPLPEKFVPSATVNNATPAQPTWGSTPSFGNSVSGLGASGGYLPPAPAAYSPPFASTPVAANAANSYGSTPSYGSMSSSDYGGSSSSAGSTSSGGTFVPPLPSP